MTEEIKSQDWKAFCDRLTEMERGHMITVETIGADGTRKEIARSLPFERIELRRRDACNDALSLQAADGFEYEIIEPIRIVLRQNNGGGFNPVEISGEAGATILHFRPALKPAVLQGLACV